MVRGERTGQYSSTQVLKEGNRDEYSSTHGTQILKKGNKDGSETGRDRYLVIT
jgi:hypothetical protein